MPTTVTVKRVGLTADLLLFRAYGQAGNTSAMLTRTLALNPGLAAFGPVLPLGTRVVLPDLDRSSVPTARKTVNLFGDT